jgi:hypothetical protein
MLKRSSSLLTHNGKRNFKTWLERTMRMLRSSLLISKRGFNSCSWIYKTRPAKRPTFINREKLYSFSITQRQRESTSFRLLLENLRT